VGSKLKEKLSLEAEINAVKEAATEKEEELRGEIERLRREKRELDSKVTPPIFPSHPHWLTRGAYSLSLTLLVGE
jgi:predicted  nucleic acid-binding Zn-ribbon protein